ncbi:MAG: DoxX family protein [Ignavibacteriales bacterium]|nr:DoxX family protein [Ignavibacteriales bacterium]
MIEKYKLVVEHLAKLKDIHLLAVRLLLAYGFYNPAIMKWQNINSIAEWFGEMGIPLPTLNAYMAASTEMAGVVLLTLGLASRIISIPLIFVMIVAIVTVHLRNGFEASNNGFEIPVYYILLLLIVLIYGAGKLSLDNIIKKKLPVYKSRTTKMQEQTKQD